uniref:Uncharacterized protein n=1 Tax=Bursaphelenchus xylophilus TaxID=6326 RepID=A0A1I7SGW7_BURXY
MLLRLLISLLFYTIILPQTQGFVRKTEANLDFDIQKAPGDKYYKAEVKDDDILDMYQKWVDTGLSSLMSAVANHKLKRQRKAVIQKYGECSSGATDIPKHAKCLTSLLKNEIKHEVKRRPRRRLQKYKKDDDSWTGGFRMAQKTNTAPLSRVRLQKYGSFRVKRSIATTVKSSDSYALSTNKGQLTPIGQIAKTLMESVKKLKGKTDIPKWQETVAKLRKNGAKRKKFADLVENDSEENMHQMQLGGLKEKILGRKNDMINEDLEEIMKSPKELKKFVEKKKIPKTKEEKIVEIVRNGLKLMYSLAGQNTTNFDEKNMKVVSPRFLGLVPEEKKEDEISLISPSLFSLHDEGEGIEKLTSLPNLLKGFSGQDQQLWLDVIMEAAGVNEESKRLEQDVKEIEMSKTRSLMTNITNLIDENGAPLYATKENVTEMGASPEYIELFERLHQNYTKDQWGT